MNLRLTHHLFPLILLSSSVELATSRPLLYTVSMVSQDQVLQKLRSCLDPELGINIVDLGLIYGVNIEDTRVSVLMTLTTPGCPLDSYFVRDITDKLKKIKGINDVSVELTFEPPWTPTKMSEESKDILGLVN